MVVPLVLVPLYLPRFIIESFAIGLLALLASIQIRRIRECFVSNKPNLAFLAGTLKKMNS
jgi:hypothetical protein